MLPHSLVLASIALLGSFTLGRSATAQGLPHADPDAPVADTRSFLPAVFHGIVLEPDGAPAACAMVVSSAGGQAVTAFDGRYRLEVQVPLDAESVQISAVAGGSGSPMASASVGLRAASGITRVEPLVLTQATTCQPRWLPTFGGQPGVDNDIHALTVFDDGSGPALHAGGSFTIAGGVLANRIAKWNGTRWSALGSGMNNDVRALTVFDDGSGSALYAGGDFTTAGGGAANRIARWNGSNWSTLGSGMNASVSALTVFDEGSGPALFAAGNFTTAGGGPANRIAKWNGSTWSALGSGMNNSVLALTVFDDGSGPALHAAGSFTTAGGVAANRIATWNGSSWSALGSGRLRSGPHGLRRWQRPGALRGRQFHDRRRPDGEPHRGVGRHGLVGAYFTTAGGVAANRIAKWSGSSWEALGTGVDGTFSTPPGVFALTIFDDGCGAALYAAGHFLTAGGVSSVHIARWDGSSWSTLDRGLGSVVDGVNTLAVFDDGSGPALYAGGDFTNAGGVPANNVAKWNGSSWSTLGSGMNDYVGALIAFDDGTGPALYAGGGFTTAGAVPANNIARWDGSSWSAPGRGMNGGVGGFTVFDDGCGPALYVGGGFTTAGGVAANSIAKWDGSSWSALGSGVNGCSALTVFDDASRPALFVGGTAFDSGDSYLAKWGSFPVTIQSKVRRR